MGDFLGFVSFSLHRCAMLCTLVQSVERRYAYLAIHVLVALVGFFFVALCGLVCRDKRAGTARKKTEAIIRQANAHLARREQEELRTFKESLTICSYTQNEETFFVRYDLALKMCKALVFSPYLASHDVQKMAHIRDTMIVSKDAWLEECRARAREAAAMRDALHVGDASVDIPFDAADKIIRELKSLKDAGAERYANLATRDAACCPVCAAMDRRDFPVEEAVTGINCPPFHEGCRCTVTAYQPR